MYSIIVLMTSFLSAIAAQSYCADQSYNPCLYRNTKVSCGMAYMQQSVSSVCQCMQLCDNDPTCAGADFINAGYNQVCQLYHGPIIGLNNRGKRSVLRSKRQQNMCGYQPAQLVQCQGVQHYCKGCNGPQTPATTQPPVTTTTTIRLPPGAQCPAGQEVRYVLIEDMRLNDPSAVSFPSSSLQQCLQACTDNRQLSGQQTPCLSVDYRSGTCTLNTDTIVPEGTRQPQSASGYSFYEKMCIEPRGGRRCPGPYLLDPQHVLVGFANMVVDASTFETCMQACVDSRETFGFDCRSGLYFYDESTSNCILNYETRDSQPDLYQEVPKSDDNVDYFEPRCTNDEAMSPTVKAKLMALQAQNSTSNV